MNREAFKLARDTLRLAVKDYGWARMARGHFDLKTDAHVVTSKRYAADPGKFEGEHWGIVHFYDAYMNGFSDESGGDVGAWEALKLDDTERAAFGLRGEYVLLWFSEQGFVSMSEADESDIEQLRAQYEESQS